MMIDPYLGKIIDKKYKLVKPLGHGGMGSVYLGEHIILNIKVAVKFLRREFATRDDVIKRFFNEAKAAAAIAHRNIINLIDVGNPEDGEPYLVMQYLRGESLAARIKRLGPFDLNTACEVMVPLLKALGAAHEKGIVHRDLKPDNIFIAKGDDDTPIIKLIDFGISKFLGHPDDEEKLTHTGAIIGTPTYMSPEQADGRVEIDHRTDQGPPTRLVVPRAAREPAGPVACRAVVLYQLFAGAVVQPLALSGSCQRSKAQTRAR